MRMVLEHAGECGSQWGAIGWISAKIGCTAETLRRIVEAGQTPAVHGVVRWRIVDLTQWVWEKFRLSLSKQTMSRELRAMGFRKLSARPRHHAKDEAAAAAF